MLIERFAWDDSTVCWLVFGAAVLCYLYKRYIEERVNFSPYIYLSFLTGLIALVTIFLFGQFHNFLDGPVAPTMMFSSIWLLELIRYGYRFHPRRCATCGRRLEVSVYDRHASLLYGEAKLHQADVWFCAQCRKVYEFGSENGEMTIMIPPTMKQIGVAVNRSVSSDKSTVYRRRVLLRPLLRGTKEDILNIERTMVDQVNKLSISNK